MHIFSKAIKFLLVLALFSCGSAHAERRQIFYSASDGKQPWKLENYMGDGVALWHTPSTCIEGSIGFPANFTNGDKNRFYATMIAVKTSNTTMFIYYDEVPGACTMVSFGLL